MSGDRTSSSSPRVSDQRVFSGRSRSPSGEFFEATGCERRAEEIPAEVFEALAVGSAHDDFGVEVEAAVSTALGTGEGAGFEGHAGADAAERSAALATPCDGGLVDAGERPELVGIGGLAAVFVVVPKAATDEVAVDAPLDGGGEGLELVVFRGRQGWKVSVPSAVSVQTPSGRMEGTTKALDTPPTSAGCGCCVAASARALLLWPLVMLLVWSRRRAATV